MKSLTEKAIRKVEEKMSVSKSENKKENASEIFFFMLI